MAQSITKIYWLHALTPLHVGEGFGIGAIDLPIVRERTTKWPLVPGSALKGVLSDHFGASAKEARNEEHESHGDHAKAQARKFAAAFGTAGNDLSNSGALVFTDSRIVAMPIQSDSGTFAWVTSKRVLMRLKRDLVSAGLGANLSHALNLTENTVHVTAKSALKAADGNVYLNDLDLKAVLCPTADAWAAALAEWLFPDPTWKAEFIARFAVLPDSTFDFFSEHATEVTARIRLEPDKKTVATGGLWYEESLPAETILAGLVWCGGVYGAGRSHFTPKGLLDGYCKSGELLVQIGGKATVGKGRVRCIFGGEHARS